MYSTTGCFISFLSTYVKVADTKYVPHEPKRNGLILIIEMRTPNFISILCSGSCFRMMWYKIKIIDVSSTSFGTLLPTLQRRWFNQGGSFRRRRRTRTRRRRNYPCNSSADIKNPWKWSAHII